ncbi:MAG: 5-(carboxyamino)imidazole ribonucleotide mutase [Syntrophomonadaceae bacterium]|nr:5-(carboxyamino)imidazole ribonucleotide mutase [Syntrophomonadaceae bacterium]MDD3022330.1 5-(carboxyamino)imidazole ribonucleotide mutase [Syntrophomonadaceae bacterium]
MPQVGIIMGSDSDLAIMKEAGDILEKFGIDYEYTICSAHRLPAQTAEYATRARDRGIEVIIAGAGGAAHLPGVIAAYTLLPVIGIPIKSSTLSGVDSLYSIVQMPRGIPVATVAINGSANAGLLALQILALKNESIYQAMLEYRQKMASEVLEKDAKLKASGASAYLNKE